MPISTHFRSVQSSASEGGDAEEDAAAGEGEATEVAETEKEEEEGDESLLGKRKMAPRAEDEEIDIDEE